MRQQSDRTKKDVPMFISAPARGGGEHFAALRRDARDATRRGATRRRAHRDCLQFGQPVELTHTVFNI